MGDREETRGQNQQRHNNAGEPLAPAIAALAPNPNQPHGEDVHRKSDGQPQNGDKWFLDPDWWMVIVTAAGFFIGFVTLLVFYSQFREMKAQTTILNTQAKQAAADAIESAKKVEQQLAIADKQARAAQGSVEAIKKQMIAAERPWLEVLDIRHSDPDAVLPPSKYWLIVTNTGRSPALAATHQFTTGVFKTFPKNPPYRQSPLHPDKMVILPGVANSTDKINKVEFQGTEEQDVVAGRKTFYVYAILHYKDPLTKQTHTTKYCSFWIPLEMNGFGDPNRPTGSFALCSFYNDAD